LHGGYQRAENSQNNRCNDNDIFSFLQNSPVFAEIYIVLCQGSLFLIFNDLYQDNCGLNRHPDISWDKKENQAKGWY
jgi:hypothetical protein